MTNGHAEVEATFVRGEEGRKEGEEMPASRDTRAVREENENGPYNLVKKPLSRLRIN